MASIKLLNKLYAPSHLEYDAVLTFIKSNYAKSSENALIYFDSPITDLDEVLQDNSAILEAHLRLLGGKGGFGTMLKSMGVRMGRCSNDDSCRNLEGRRLRDVRNDKKVEEWLATHPPEEEKESQTDRKINKLKKIVDSASAIKAEDKILVENSFKSLQTINESIIDAVSEAVAKKEVVKSKPQPKMVSKAKTKKNKNFLWGLDDDSSDDSDSSSSNKQKSDSDIVQ